MAGLPVATVTNMHTCPMVTGLIPHVGGPIVGPGCMGVLIDGLPVSVIGDSCVCVGPPDVIAQGHPGILADGMPIALQTYMTTHGGVIMQGNPGVMAGSATPSTTFLTSCDVKFPSISAIGALVAGASQKQAKENIKKTKEESEKSPMLPKFEFSI